MKSLYAADKVELSGTSVTEEGFLVAPGTLARTGVQDYYAFELGIKSLDAMKKLRLFRPAEEVFSADSLRSFENKPITIDHPSNGVDSSNWGKLAKGEVRDIKQDGQMMKGTLLVKSKDAIDAIRSGKNQLSNGYTFDLDMTSGVAPDGTAYDGVQRNIRGNHLAIVDAARCGSACRISDSFPNLNSGVPTMPDATMRKVTVDGIPLDVSEVAAAAIEKLTTARDTAVNALSAASKPVKIGDKEYTLAELAELTKLATDQQTQIVALQKDVMTPAARDAMVAEWAKMATDAKALAPEVAVDGKTCLAVRREVIASVVSKDAVAATAVNAVLAGKTLEVADADTVRAAFGVVAAFGTKTKSNVDDSAAASAALLGNGKGDDQKPKLVGRDAMLARQQAASRGEK